MLLQLLKSKHVILLATFITLASISYAQLKVGDNPTNIQKSSILELESSRQGLLLPRLDDTAAINALNPPDGMIIYLNGDKSVRLRSNGIWKKLADMNAASSNWSATGNSGIDPSLNFLGTVDGQPLILKTNNAEAIRIDAAGNIGIGTNNPSAKLDVDGSVKLRNISDGNTEMEVLVLGNDGSVYKRTMSSAAFNNAVQSINGMQKQSISITAAASDTTNNVLVQNRTADSTVAIYLPVQDGSTASKPYGFLTYTDWQKLQSAVQTVTIGAVASSPDAKGASVISDSTSRTIVLHPADATNPGIVTAGDQTFGGNKTFVGNTTVDGTLTVGTLNNNTSADSVLVVNNGVIEKRKVSASTFGTAVASINGNTEAAQKIAFRNSGSDVSISTNGTDSLYLNMPDAGTAARGLVTTDAQTFAGTKTFQDSVAATKAMNVGSSSNANSTMQVSGSLAMSINTVTSNYTLTNTDNTVLANCSSAAITLTLPSPSNIAGRIYTIKKIGSGGIDKELVITPTSGTIDGGSSFTIYNDWTFVTLQTDGSNWYIIKK